MIDVARQVQNLPVCYEDIRVVLAVGRLIEIGSMN